MIQNIEDLFIIYEREHPGADHQSNQGQGGVYNDKATRKTNLLVCTSLWLVELDCWSWRRLAQPLAKQADSAEPISPSGWSADESD